MHLRTRHLLILSAFLFLTGANDQIEEKPKKSFPSVREQQAEPTNQKDTAAKNQTAQSTPIVILNNVPTGGAENPPQKEPDKWPPMWTIWVTLGITGLASVAALLTVGSIRGQAQAATAQAETTAAQVELMAESERPWLIFKPGDPNNGRRIDRMWPLPEIFREEVDLFNVPWNIINVGRSPAFLTELNRKIEIIEINKMPPALTKGPTFNLILSPKAPPEDRFGSDSRRPLSEIEFYDLRNGKLCVWVYGIAEYMDALKKPHATKFCCRWFVENGQATYDPVGPEGWTEYT